MSIRSPSGVSAPGDRLGALGDRQALPGQRGLVDLQRGGAQQPAVGRHQVAGLDRARRRRARGPRPGARRAAPSRRTRALTIIICCSAPTAAAALPSWRSPSTALNSVSASSSSRCPLLERVQAAEAGHQQHDLHRVGVLPQERPPPRLLLASANRFGPNRAPGPTPRRRTARPPGPRPAPATSDPRPGCARRGRRRAPPTRSRWSVRSSLHLSFHARGRFRPGIASCQVGAIQPSPLPPVGRHSFRMNGRPPSTARRVFIRESPGVRPGLGTWSLRRTGMGRTTAAVVNPVITVADTINHPRGATHVRCRAATARPGHRPSRG